MQKRSSCPPGNEPVRIVAALNRLDGDFPVSAIGDDCYTPAVGPPSCLHYHDDFEIGYCYAGSGIFIVDGRILPYRAGDATVIFAGETHIAQSNPGDPGRWHFVNLKPEALLAMLLPPRDRRVLSGLLPAPEFPSVLSPRDHPGITETIREIVEELGRRGPFYEQAVAGLIYCLLARLARLSAAPGEEERRPGPPEQRLFPALERIYRRYSEPLSIPGLAAACAMSPPAFRRAFGRAMGMAPHQYLTEVRIRMASVLLGTTDRPVLAVSELCGFESLSSFNRCFRRVMGASPGQWRKGATLQDDRTTGGTSPPARPG